MSAWQLAQRHGVDVPFREVHAILYEGKSPKQAVRLDDTGGQLIWVENGNFFHGACLNRTPKLRPATTNCWKLRAGDETAFDELGCSSANRLHVAFHASRP